MHTCIFYVNICIIIYLLYDNLLNTDCLIYNIYVEPTKYLMLFGVFYCVFLVYAHQKSDLDIYQSAFRWHNTFRCLVIHLTATQIGNYWYKN